MKAMIQMTIEVLDNSEESIDRIYDEGLDMNHFDFLTNI